MMLRRRFIPEICLEEIKGVGKVLDNYYEGSLTNELNKTNLDYIDIYGLFGKYDIHIPFDKEVNIFIGENGVGKTTILNIIYFILSKNLNKLKQINFSKVIIKFKKERKILTIQYNDINKNENYLENEEEFINYISKQDNDNDNLSYSELSSLAREFNISHARMREILLNNYCISEINDKKNHNLKEIIARNISESILYLPTYRRIESEMNSYRFLKGRFVNDNLLIHFGMRDVEQSIADILNKIKNISIQGYTKMTELLLKQYTDGIQPQTDYFNNSRINFDEWSLIVEIILERINEKIDDEFKSKILHLIKTREIKQQKYIYLVGLLDKLIDNYKIQREYDDKINMFCKTCNKYLIGKYLEYSLTSLKVRVRLIEHGKICNDYIALEDLSSGEKQIVSLFAKLYLSDKKKRIVIIDEPELSLSIKWQKMLLPDIMRSNNCDLLLTVTHSPFIFDNEYDNDAKDIKRYITL